MRSARRGARWTARSAATPLGCALLAGVATALLLLFAPPGGDDAAHLYLTQAWREHGWQLWDNLWYSGRYAQVNYSLLYYPLAAAIGTTAAVALSCAGAAAAFCALVRRRWPALAALPAVAFAALVPLGAVAGTYPFLLGLALALGALVALVLGRPSLALAGVLLAGLAHPLALAFLLVTLAAVAVVTPGWWRRRRNLVVAGGAVVAGLAQAVLLRGFPSDGARYPFDPKDALVVAAFCVTALLFTRGLPDQRPIRALFVGYGLLVLAAFLVPSPMGGNAARLVLLMGVPLLLLPFAARGYRPRALVTVLVGAGLFWQALPAIAGWQTTARARAQDGSFWYPVIAFLDDHPDMQHRVQVVATADNWEAWYLARRGVPLARGWFRQDDFPANAALYRPNLTPAAYRAWLRQTGVRYVFLPDDPLDYSAHREAALLRSGRSGLRRIERVGGWTMFELPHAVPIATPADSVSVLAYTSREIALRVTRPGVYRLRVRWTPYWSVEHGAACAGPRRPWGTELRVSRPGVVRLGFDVRLGTFVGAVLGSQGGCAAVPPA